MTPSVNGTASARPASSTVTRRPKGRSKCPNSAIDQARGTTGTAAAPAPKSERNPPPISAPTAPVTSTGAGNDASARKTPASRATTAHSSSRVRDSIRRDPPVRIHRQHRVGVLVCAQLHVLAVPQLGQLLAVRAGAEGAQPALAAVAGQLQRGQRAVAERDLAPPALR